MTFDLEALAQRIAAELARGDLAGAKAAGGREPAGTPSTPGRAVAPMAAAVAGAPAPLGVSYSRDNSRIADYIDHTLLKAEATGREVEQLCAEAAEHRFAAVCVNPVWVPLCAKRLGGKAAKVATVIGFPLGATQPRNKADEARRAVDEGADELDMVAAIGHIKSGDWGHVRDDIGEVVRAGSGRLVKVIIESAVLSPVEIIKVCALSREVGAHYVKTSTGFHAAGGATAEAIALMRLVVGDALGVKASGGVRDCGAALKMISAGATRIGTSSGVAMVQCLGPGPLPLGELLTTPHEHTGRCITCTTPAPAAPSAQPY